MSFFFLHRKLFILIILALLIGGTTLWRCNQATPSQSSTAHYVGIQNCQSCHQEIYEDFVQTGMGRSMYVPVRKESIELFDSSNVVYDSFKDFYYFPHWKGDKMYIKEFRLVGKDTIFERNEHVDYVVGSGNQTRSYFLQREGYVYEFPITWYVEKQLWDLSPGYENGNNSRFSREIGSECLHCHTAQYELVAGSKNKYQHIDLGINCERCHGPGSEHLAQVKTGNPKEGIVHPYDLSINERFDVCQQCHLQGINVLKDDKKLTDFKAGMRLNDVYEVFLPKDTNASAFGIASHAARLQESACFIQTNGKLSCITCHDPHKSVHQLNKNIYIQQCRQCHQIDKSGVCRAPEKIQMQANGNCISCHMPVGGTSDIPHVRFHDHKIRLVEKDSLEIKAQATFLELLCATSQSTNASELAKAWIKYYEEIEPQPFILDSINKYLGASDFEGKAIHQYYVGNFQEALNFIEKALAETPENTNLLARKGEILEAMGNHKAAYKIFQTIFAKEEENIEVGLKIATNLLKAYPGQAQTLIDANNLLESLRQKKPFDIRILSNLAFVLLNQNNIPQAEAYLVQALNLDPDHLTSLENMCYVQLQKKNQVLFEEYFQHLQQKHPQSPVIIRLKRLGKIG